jgi:dipeptide/tripeptide permease
MMHRPTKLLAAWIVLFAMAGLYLLGLLRMEGIKPDEPMGLGRLLTGAAFLVFAISLLAARHSLSRFKSSLTLKSYVQAHCGVPNVAMICASVSPRATPRSNGLT